MQLNSEAGDVFEKHPIGTFSYGAPIYAYTYWCHATESSPQQKSSPLQTSSQVVHQIVCKYNFSVLQFKSDFKHLFHCVTCFNFYLEISIFTLTVPFLFTPPLKIH